ncbi:ferredoxin [Streptomyces scopuliridis]|uniref:ferredoxin n=1 Tax=Streptomyces scopuliridis TaxID=452529 RepID=UPI002DD7B8E5|nr:ferredoxin [Streptomyces scopuliridis]WSB38181.1 ferredoxin [Streptomyces scopuliridis]
MGSGMCAGMAPDHFTLEGDRARPLAGSVVPHEAVLDAADSCPAMAITVVDGGREIAPRP